MIRPEATTTADPTSTATQGRERRRALSTGHFRKVGVNGFGDPANAYAYSYAWYDDHLYIGTIRHLLVLVKKRLPLNTPSVVWPVPLPESDDDLDLRAQIWRYNPRTSTWERVYRSPMTEGIEGRTVPLSSGFRNMAVFQGKSDARPAIYTVTSCGTYGIGPVLLRASDGLDFQVVSEPGLGIGDSRITTFRGVYAFKDRLFLAPVGSRGGNCNTAYNAVILCSDDPAQGRFKQSNPSSFGDPTNMGIYDFCASGDHLYATTANYRKGCQVWRTLAEGPPPHRWEKMLDLGADRGVYNEAAICMASFQGNLYLGTAIQNGGYDQLNMIGPAAGEVIRLRPDGTWDLIVGEARMTRQGFKAPSSGMGPGFDNPFAGYIWRMCAHDGGLYVGTYDSSSFLPYSDLNRWPKWSRNLVDAEFLDRFMEQRGGCELWRTNDGDNWVAVTRNGFNNPFNYGIRTLYSTPVGLFVGSANPFGPEVAVRGAAGWRYESNPRGGIEIWHGSLENAGREDSEAPSPYLEAAAVGLATEGSAEGDLFGRLLSEIEASEPPAGDSPAVSEEGRDLLDGLMESVCRHSAHTALNDRLAGWEFDPVAKLAAADSELVGLTEDLEAELNEFYGGTDLRSVGFWTKDGSIPRLASEQLLKELLALAVDPQPEIAKPAMKVLAMGSCAGPLAAAIEQSLPNAEVSSDMADTSTWASDQFDLVVWIEGPSAKGKRASALNQAARVLRKGGRLVAADLIGIPADVEFALLRSASAANLDAEYREDLKAAGFGSKTVVDATERTWKPFFDYSRAYFASKLMLRQMDREEHDRTLASLPGGGSVVAAYLIVSALKGE